MKKQRLSTTHSLRAASGFTALLAGCLVLTSSVAKADTVIYSQNFDSYSDNTLMTDVPGWYNWGAQVPLIIGGKAKTTSAGSWCDMLLDMTDIFSYGNSAARIEFDATGAWQEDPFFGPGDAATLQFNYSQALGWENGPYNNPNALYTVFNGGGFDQSTQNWTNGANAIDDRLEYHYVVNICKKGNFITWTATVNGQNLFGGGHSAGSFTLTDSRGINTFEWFGAWQSNWPDTNDPAQMTLDNVVITAITTPPPAPLSYAVNYNGTYQGGDYNVVGPLGPDAASTSSNWNNINPGQDVNSGIPGDFTVNITDSNGVNPISLFTDDNGVDGGDDGHDSPPPADDFERLFFTGIRDGDTSWNIKTTVAPFDTYDVYIYAFEGRSYGVNSGNTTSWQAGGYASTFVLGQNYQVFCGLTGPLNIRVQDGIRGFSIVRTSAPSDAYADWAAAKGLTGGNNGKTVDAEGDGVSNVLEFYLDGDPLAGDAPNMAGDVSGGNLVLTFKRRDDAEYLNIVPQSSTGLSGWATLVDGVGGVSIATSENGLSPDDVTISVPVGAEPRNFARLLFTP